MENHGISYNIQEALNMEGYFLIKVTPFGENLYLLEEREEIELKALLEEARDYIWWWFKTKR